MSSYRNPFSSPMVLVGLLTALALGFTTSAQPVGAQQVSSSLSMCQGCDGPCPLEFGSSCEYVNRAGGNTCEQGNMPAPLPGGGDGCSCAIGGGVCGLKADMGVGERSAHERQALEVLAHGRMLPADGFFYFGRSRGELVLRWKCDNSVAGRVAIADSGRKRGVVLGG